MTNLRNFIGLFLVAFLCFTACKKDNLTPETADTETPETISAPTLDIATQTRAMAAVASMSNSRNSDTLTNDCGCYDLFDGIDLDAPHEVVEAAIEATLATLSEEEIIRFFAPVCTDDGEIYESACIADCEGITNYHVCSDDELEDYFFDEFDCEDLDNLTFPTEIELPDGTKVTVNNEEELFDLIDQWYEENEDDDFDYEGEWEDGDFDDDDFEDCFTIVFPISVKFPDGEIIIYDSEDALYTGIDAWYDRNPNSDNDPLPIYPFEVILEDSTSQTISNEVEEAALWASCFGDLDFDICFKVNFPVTVIYPDSSTLEVNSEIELALAVEAYYEENEDSEDDLEVQYPISINLSDGTVQILNNEEELEAALAVCFDSESMGRFSNTSQKSALSAKRVVQGQILSGHSH